MLALADAYVCTHTLHCHARLYMTGHYCGSTVIHNLESQHAGMSSNTRWGTHGARTLMVGTWGLLDESDNDQTQP
jgi:hypothetical protein